MVDLKRAINGKPKNPAAVELGRLGGRAGGQARAATLTPERRVRIARQAALKRWAKRGAESAQRALRGRPHKTELEARIVSTATKMFAERGFHAMTMRDVAREARVGLSTIYLFFTDKRDLYLRCSIALAELYAQKQRNVMDQVQEGAERIYAFAYAYCRIQSDPAAPKLIHRQLMDRDLGALKPLAEGIFLQQFVELRKSAALIVGSDKADLVTFAIFATAFGLIRLSPLSEYIAALSPAAGDPGAIARGTLSLLFPSLNWDDIARSLDHRLSLAYSL
jgi:TetR/AcrR family transcriptional regulator